MDRHGNLHISHNDVGSLISFHTSFLHGEPVVCAGEIKIQNGKIVYMDNESGHYLPRCFHLDQAISILNRKGVLADDCEFDFYFHKGQSVENKAFTSIKAYKEWDGYTLTNEDKEKFIKSESNNMEKITKALAPIITKDLEPINYNAFQIHKNNFNSELKDINKGLRTLLWKGYIRDASEIIYHPIIKDRRTYDNFESHSHSNAEDTFNNNFIKGSIELKVLMEVLDDLSNSKEYEEISPRLEEFKKSFESVKKKHRNFPSEFKKSTEILQKHELFKKERVGKIKGKVLKIIQEGYTKKNGHLDTDRLFLEFNKAKVYNLESLHTIPDNGSKFLGNSKIVNMKEFLEWRKENPVFKSDYKSSFCKTDDTLCTVFKLTTGAEATFDLMMSYKDSRSLEKCYLECVYDDYKKYQGAESKDLGAVLDN